MTQTDIVYSAINKMGGTATLQQIFEQVLNDPSFCWTTKTPEASIRRILRNTKGIFMVRKGIYTIVENSSCASFLYRKLVDKSVLTEGFSIPKNDQLLFQQLAGGKLLHGESRNVKVILEGEEFECKFKNVAFDTDKYDRSDILQFP